jgi:hypothetical protein
LANGLRVSPFHEFSGRRCHDRLSADQTDQRQLARRSHPRSSRMSRVVITSASWTPLRATSRELENNCVALNPRGIFHVKHSASSVLNPLGTKGGRAWRAQRLWTAPNSSCRLSRPSSCRGPVPCEPRASRQTREPDGLANADAAPGEGASSDEGLVARSGFRRISRTNRSSRGRAPFSLGAATTLRRRDGLLGTRRLQCRPVRAAIDRSL